MKILLKILNNLTNSPIFSYSDFTKKFIVQTDACDNSIGCVLSQIINNKKKLYMLFMSDFKPSSKNNSVTDKKTLAIVWGIKENKYNFISNKFEIMTDYNSLTYLNSIRDFYIQVAQ